MIIEVSYVGHLDTLDRPLIYCQVWTRRWEARVDKKPLNKIMMEIIWGKSDIWPGWCQRLLWLVTHKCNNVTHFKPDSEEIFGLWSASNRLSTWTTYIFESTVKTLMRMRWENTYLQETFMKFIQTIKSNTK